MIDSLVLCIMKKNEKHELIAHKIGDDKITKIDIDKFNRLKKFYDGKR